MQLTKSEIAVLRAIDAAPDKVLPFYVIRETVGLTVKGGQTVVNRMDEARLIRRSELRDTYRDWTITFKGMQALQELAA